MNIKQLTLVSITALALSACATQNEPSFGDNLLNRSQQQKDLANQWHDGAELLTDSRRNLKKGQDKVDRGQSLLDEGHAQLEEAKTQATEGMRKQQEALTAFEALRANPIQLPTSLPAAAAQ